MKKITIILRPANEPYPLYSTVMYVQESNHPRFTVGKRFDYGFMSIAVEEGYTITVLPLGEAKDETHTR